MASSFIQRQKSDFFRDLTSFGSLWFYIIFILIFLILKNYGIFNQLLIGFVLMYIIIISIRLFYFKNRPQKYSYNNLIEKIDASSFPSLHAARISYSGIIFMSYFNNIIFSALMIVLIIIVAYSRIYLKKHDFKDVFAGVVVGLVVYFVVKIIFI